MNKERAGELLEKYMNGTASPEERALLERFYLEESSRWELPDTPIDFKQKKSEIWKAVHEQTAGPRPGRVIRIGRLAAAAVAVLLVLSTAVYYYIRPENIQVRQDIADDVPPGGNRATLTLADGSRVVLDDLVEGEIARETGVAIRKTGNGQIVYGMAAGNETPPGNMHRVAFNKIETPRGGQYRVVLPDGTKVWLNAASSLRYPARFTGNERQVELTGEGYFEVAPDKEAPFFVATATQEVKVLGTHFNVNAYKDEDAAKTTLLEGSVMIRAKSQPCLPAGREPRTKTRVIDSEQLATGNQQLLKPGQQARISRGGSEIQVLEVDPEEAIAWKNGLFRFENASLETVMRRLARWYDVEVVYEGEIPDEVFTGKIYRDINASDALEILSYTNIRFRIEGKKIIISP